MEYLGRKIKSFYHLQKTYYDDLVLGKHQVVLGKHQGRI